jgi:hypothetical protein
MVYCYCWQQQQAASSEAEAAGAQRRYTAGTQPQHNQCHRAWTTDWQQDIGFLIYCQISHLPGASLGDLASRVCVLVACYALYIEWCLFVLWRGLVVYGAANIACRTSYTWHIAAYMLHHIGY